MSSLTTIEKPMPLKCMPIAFVLSSKFSFTMTMEEPTMRTMAEPNPAMTLEINHRVSLVVVASMSVVRILRIDLCSYIGIFCFKLIIISHT